MMEEMNEGLTLNISKGQYPKLENLAENSKFTFSGEGTVSWQGENGTITFNSFDVQTENRADKEMRELKGTPETYAGNESSDVEM